MDSVHPVKIPNQVFYFVIVGGIGFLVDAGLLMSFIVFMNADPVWARLFSFAVAVSVTWYLNGTLTFKGGSFVAGKSLTPQYFRYLSVQIIGAGINFSIFYLLVRHTDGVLAFPLAALSCGALVSMTFTFLLSKYCVFTAHS